MKYDNISIKKAMQMIKAGQMFLPEIQRGFVWKENQIENLFDSIILGYPIGTLLFWKTTKNEIHTNKYPLYEFIRDFHERDKKDNIKAPEKIVTDFPYFYIVLDGQQRLSSIYIALQGSLSYKIKKKWWNSNDAFPQKYLYYNLDSDLTKKADDDGYIPRFKFYSEDYVPQDNLWYKVSDILDFSSGYDMNKYTMENGFNNIQYANLNRLYEIVNDEADKAILNFYAIEEANYDDVLNIFVRVNSSGTYLSKTDLLFSTLVSGWKGGREIVEKLISNINSQGEKFNFTKDFVMRASLVLTGAPVNLKIESFKTGIVEKIRQEFDNISVALIKMVKMLVDIGYCNDNITSYNALIPIAYYLYKGGKDSDKTIEGIRKYLAVVFIKNIYGVASNAAMSSTRAAIDKIKDCSKVDFSVDIFQDIVLTGNRDFKISSSDIDKCFTYQKGLYTFYILSMLYPNLKLGETTDWHQDHVHPFTGFDTNKLKRIGVTDKDTIERWQRLRNTIPNLQLLTGKENEIKNKTPLKDWIDMNPVKNDFDYHMEGISLDLKDFENFYDKRYSLMRKKLEEIFE